MRATSLSTALGILIDQKRPTILWGAPGIGKSDIVRQTVKGKNLDIIDVRTVLLDPVDLRGVPSIDGRKTTWNTPAFLPTIGAGVIFLDEIGQAPAMVQAACLQLILDRRLGEYTLPKDWTIIAASNRQEDRAGANRMITPLLNRFVHLDLEVSKDDWKTWSVPAGICPEVRSFIDFRPSLLHAFDPAKNERAFPTPRSWSFVSQLFPNLTPDLLMPVISGTVGEGPAAEFVAFVKTYRELPTAAEIFANPTGITVPTDPSVLYALCGMLSEAARKATDKELSATATYASRLGKEFSVLLVRDCTAANQKILNVKELQPWLRANRELLISSR